MYVARWKVTFVCRVTINEVEDRVTDYGIIPDIKSDIIDKSDTFCHLFLFIPNRIWVSTVVCRFKISTPQRALEAPSLAVGEVKSRRLEDETQAHSTEKEHEREGDQVQEETRHQPGLALTRT